MSCLTLLHGSPAQRVFVEPCNVVSGCGVERAAFNASEQRQLGLQAGISPILECMHRVAQRRRSTRESVQQTRALLNERRRGGFKCQSRTGRLRRAPCRRPLNRYPSAGRLELELGTWRTCESVDAIRGFVEATAMCRSSVPNNIRIGV